VLKIKDQSAQHQNDIPTCGHEIAGYEKQDMKLQVIVGVSIGIGSLFILKVELN